MAECPKHPSRPLHKGSCGFCKRDARIQALEAALRWTWDYLAPDEDVEVDGGPECGPVTVNVRHDIITALMEDEQFTEERSAQLEAVIRETLDA